jgi:glycosyltransferase involved in cell wall biosynthesis
MRVLLDATYAARAPYSGTGVYTQQLRRALSGVGVEPAPVSDPRRRPPAGGGLGSVRNLIADVWWGSVELPRLAALREADVIHHPLPARARRARVPQVITVHDLAFERLPACFDRRFRLYAHRAHRAAARAADAVICVSETTAADVRELWRVDPDRIVVARHGPGQPLPRTQAEPEDPEHFLYVGDAEPRKNVATLLAAYRRYRELVADPLPLVLAGSASSAAPGVIVDRDPTPDRLAELYARAAALIQPSLYEGFGLTAVEAMGAGAPVIASDIPGLRETCGEAARYFDPLDTDALAAAMAELGDGREPRAELCERGVRRAAEFSWESSARAHEAAYSLALGSR